MTRTEEATDPITPTVHNPSQSYADHTKESGSSVAEKIAEAMQPGGYSPFPRVSGFPMER
jgi:hypothetical protein